MKPHPRTRTRTWVLKIKVLSRTLVLAQAKQPAAPSLALGVPGVPRPLSEHDNVGG